MGGSGEGTGRGGLLPGQRCAVPLLLRGGTVQCHGQALSAREVAERVGWLVGLTRTAAEGLVEQAWNEPALRALASGVDGQGRRLPSNGWMAARRLGWDAAVPDGSYLPDRVRRCAQEQAVRLLRSALHRRTALAVLLASWPRDGAGGPSRTGCRGKADWQALRVAARTARVEIDRVTVRNLTREPPPTGSSRC